MDRQKLAKLVPITTILGLVVALFLFERLNFITTYEALVAAFGNGDWIWILSWGVVLTDFFTVARVFVAGDGKSQEPQIVSILFAVWAGVAMFDMFLTWYYASLQMEVSSMTAPSILGNYPSVIMPMVVAIMVWGVQLALIYIFGLTLEKALYGRVRPSVASPKAALQNVFSPQKTN